LSFCTAEDRYDLQAIERLLRTPLQKAEDPPGYTSPKAAPPSVPGKNVARKPRRPSHRSRSGAQPGTGSNGSTRNNRPRRKVRKSRARLSAAR
jgi:hypothetical protein